MENKYKKSNLISQIAFPIAERRFELQTAQL